MKQNQSSDVAPYEIAVPVSIFWKVLINRKRVVLIEQQER